MSLGACSNNFINIAFIYHLKQKNPANLFIFAFNSKNLEFQSHQKISFFILLDLNKSFVELFQFPFFILSIGQGSPNDKW